jgi:long-subunit fatty acid transport protein
MTPSFPFTRSVLAAALLAAVFSTAQAQYSFDALRLSTQLPGQDAHSIALGSSSVSQLQGFGSHLVNPAVAARVPASTFSAGIGVRDISTESNYLGQFRSFSDNQTGITHVGFNYKMPTVTGSLVLGGGYVQTTDYNSAFTVEAYNDLTSRTYQFLTDYTNEIAYNTFAIDDLNGFQESVFEYGGFQGVDQLAETTRRGQSGEYSLYLATEFQENFYLGLSVGIPVSKSVFNQVFIERSPLDVSGRPVYSGELNTGTYNIDRMLFEEKITVDAVGYNARLGFLFTGLEFVDLGASYTTSTRWNVEERFDAFIQTRFQDVVTVDGSVMTDGSGNTYGPQLSGDLSGEYSYKVRTPARIHLGASTKGLPFANLSGSAERINYSSIRLSGFDSADRDVEIDENNFINRNFKDVWNFRAGAAFTMFDSFEPRVGWSYMPNPISYLNENDRHYLSAGIGIGINQRTSLDFGLQYGFWETTEDLYSVDASTGIIVDPNTNAPVTFIETADKDVARVHATFGISFRF